MNKSALNSSSLIVRNKVSDSEKLSAFFSDFIKSCDTSEEIIHDLRLSMEEIFINIASYAFTDHETHNIRVEFTQDADTIRITFIDSGYAFNPLTDSEKKIDNTEHSEGGMGIHLIMSLTDGQEYKRIEQQNVFTVTKNYT